MNLVTLGFELRISALLTAFEAGNKCSVVKTNLPGRFNRIA